MTEDYLVDQFATREGSWDYFFSRPLVEALVARGANPRAHVALSTRPVAARLTSYYGQQFVWSMSGATEHDYTSSGLLPIALFCGTDIDYLLNVAKVDINEDNGAALMAVIAYPSDALILKLRQLGAHFNGYHRSLMQEKRFSEEFIKQVEAAGD